MAKPDTPTQIYAGRSTTHKPQIQYATIVRTASNFLRLLIGNREYHDYFCSRGAIVQIYVADKHRIAANGKSVARKAGGVALMSVAAAGGVAERDACNRTTTARLARLRICENQRAVAAVAAQPCTAASVKYGQFRHNTSRWIFRLDAKLIRIDFRDSPPVDGRRVFQYIRRAIRRVNVVRHDKF